MAGDMKLFAQLTIVSILSGLCRVHASSEADENDPLDKRILIQDNYYSIMSQLEALTKKVDNLTAQNHNLADPSGKGVAFHVKLTTAVTGASRYIHYDNVMLNLGNGYNANHGVFVAPVSGTYLFSLYVCAPSNTVAILNLFVNKTLEGTMLAGDDQYTNCNSEVFVVNVAAGTDVYVKSHDSQSTSIAVYPQYGLPKFTGVLIQPHA